MKYFAKYLLVKGEIQEEKGGFVSRIPDSKKLFLCSRDNPEYKQEILTEGIKEGQEFTEEEKDFLTLL